MVACNTGGAFVTSRLDRAFGDDDTVSGCVRCAGTAENGTDRATRFG